MLSNWPDVLDVVELCEHVASGKSPILRGCRVQPAFPNDSGWRFGCDRSHDDPGSGYQTRRVKYLVASDPTVCYIIDSPMGTTVERSGPEADWIVSHAECSQVDP